MTLAEFWIAVEANNFRVDLFRRIVAVNTVAIANRLGKPRLTVNKICGPPPGIIEFGRGPGEKERFEEMMAERKKKLESRPD